MMSMKIKIRIIQHIPCERIPYVSIALLMVSTFYYSPSAAFLCGTWDIKLGRLGLLVLATNSYIVVSGPEPYFIISW
jgi:hypothetical protein